MNKGFRNILLGISAIMLIAILILMQLKSKLEAAKVAVALPVIAQVADFGLTNQDGAAVSLAALKGHVWVGDIIFTRCPGPCARMTAQMKELQAALAESNGSSVAPGGGTDGAARRPYLVSLTTDADFDTPEVLQRYAARFNAQPGNWMFLTGDKKAIADLAIDSLKLTALEKPAAERTSPEDLFVHSTIFVLVDKRAQVRGVFETGGEGVDWNESKRQILAAVKQLEEER